MSGLYKNIIEKNSTLDKKIYNKSSLTAISHAIEDVVSELELQADMYVFFQKEKFFLLELVRYQRLAEICQNLYLFAEEFSPEVREKIPQATLVDLNSFAPKISQEMLKEWSVIVEHQDYSMALITREIPELQEIENDVFRTFKGSLIFDLDLISRSIEEVNLLLELDLAGPERTGVEEKEIKDYEQREDQKILTLFLNNALTEVENNLNIMANQNVMLEHSLAENEKRTKEVIKRLCFAAEYKDEDTALHLIRLSFTATLLYAQVVSDWQKLELMFYSSLMHDIGKIGVPDKILFKPGSLNEAEFAEVKKHPEIARQILRNSDHEMITMAQNIAYTHHEKWDGSGYPQGLAGKEIPLEGRIVAIADVFDALLAERVYKEAYSLAKAREIMLQEKDSHFDGDLLEIFFANLDFIMAYRKQISQSFASLEEHEVTAHYFQLEPNFAVFARENSPAFSQVFEQAKSD